VCQTLDDVRRELVRLRLEVSEAPAKGGFRGRRRGHSSLLPLGRSEGDPQAPLSRDKGVVPAARPRTNHLRMPRSRRNRRKEAATQTMNRCRVWMGPPHRSRGQLAVLAGRGLRLCKLRTGDVAQWPLAGVLPKFDSRALRRAHRCPGCNQGHKGRDQDLLGHSPVHQVRNTRVPRYRRLYDARRGRNGGRSHASTRPHLLRPRSPTAIH
jgi:hypothetical protein